MCVSNPLSLRLCLYSLLCYVFARNQAHALNHFAGARPCGENVLTTALIRMKYVPERLACEMMGPQCIVAGGGGFADAKHVDSRRPTVRLW